MVEANFDIMRPLQQGYSRDVLAIQLKSNWFRQTFKNSPRIAINPYPTLHSVLSTD
jgi:hypothetical protein